MVKNARRRNKMSRSLRTMLINLLENDIDNVLHLDLVREVHKTDTTLKSIDNNYDRSGIMILANL